jgi:uncharacterized protein YqgQ
MKRFVKLANLLDRYGFISQANFIDRLIKISTIQDIDEVKALYKLHDEIIDMPIRKQQYIDSHALKIYTNVVVSFLRKVQRLVNEKDDRLDERVRDFCKRHMDWAWEGLREIEVMNDLGFQRMNIEFVLSNGHKVLEELLSYFREGSEFKGIIV